MTMDLTVDELRRRTTTCVDYMDGSAAVIGEMMLPILEPPDLAAATPPARDLGEAFQLTNFLRDIGEDLDRGRQYVPQEDLRRFGVDLDRAALHAGVRRADALRDRPLPGAVPPSADVGHRHAARRVRRAASRAAHDLYGRILDRIEAQGYDVFSSRARVSTPAKLRRRGATRCGRPDGAAPRSRGRRGGHDDRRG